MPTLLKRLLLVLASIVVVLAILILVPFLYVRFGCWDGAQSTTLETAPTSTSLGAEVPNYLRAEEKTYLTFPEWYIVYSADEYAEFLKEHSASDFPYLAAIGQFWHSYSCVYHLTREAYPFNSENHIVLGIIGTSFTLENGLKGAYEKTVGRLSSWFGLGERVSEEIYAQQVAAEYGTFLHTIPWYEFPFGAKLRGLWQETTWWGKHPIRKWERKVALSTEYGSKALYAGIIKKATQAAFVPAELTTYATVLSLPASLPQGETGIEVVQQLAGTGTIITMPRYEAFTQITVPLLRQGVAFADIAGNDELLVSVFAPPDWIYAGVGGPELFRLPLLTHPQQDRVVLRVPVASLHTIVPALEAQGITIEHLYDY